MAATLSKITPPTGTEQRLYLRAGLWVVEDAIGYCEFASHAEAHAFRAEMNRHLQANRLRVVQGGR